MDNTLRDRVGFWGACAGPHNPWGSLPARDIPGSHTEQCRDPVLNTNPKTLLWQHPQSGKGPLDPSKSHKTPAPAPSGGAPGGCGGPDEAAFAALLNQVSGVSSGQRSRLAPALGAEHGNSEAGESSSGSALPREKDPAAPPILPAAPRRKGSFGGPPVIPAPPQAGIREEISIGRSGSKSRPPTAAPWPGFRGMWNSHLPSPAAGEGFGAMPLPDGGESPIPIPSPIPILP